MDEIIKTIALMSLKASVVLILVLAARLLLKNAPKKYSYVLWAVVLFRLICPFSPELSFGALDFSVINSGMENMRESNYYQNEDGGARGIQNTTQTDSKTVFLPPQNNAETDANAGSAAQKISYTTILGMIWIAGIAVMLSTGMLSYIKLKKKLKTVTLVSDNVFESSVIGTAFVLGLFIPKIYLPSKLCEAERTYVLEHEHMHIRYGDNIIKFIAYLALSIHWFNPLMWLAFALMTKDMEMKCDEAVVKKLGGEIRRDYGQSILTLAVKGRFPVANPLAFGESNTKQRVKNIMKYKKPTFWIATAAVMLCLIVGIFSIIERKSMQEDNQPIKMAKENDNLEQNITEEQNTKAKSETSESDASLTEAQEQAKSKNNEKLLASGNNLISSVTTDFSNIPDETLRQMLMLFPLYRDKKIDWNKLTYDNLCEFFVNVAYLYPATKNDFSSKSSQELYMKIGNEKNKQFSELYQQASSLHEKCNAQNDELYKLNMNLEALKKQLDELKAAINKKDGADVSELQKEYDLKTEQYNNAHAAYDAAREQCIADQEQYEQLKQQMMINNHNGMDYVRAYTLDEFNSKLKKIYGENARVTKKDLTTIGNADASGNFSFEYFNSHNAFAVFAVGMGFDWNSYHPYQIQQTKTAYIVDVLKNDNMNDVDAGFDDYINASVNTLLSLRKERLLSTIEENMLNDENYKKALLSANSSDEKIKVILANDSYFTRIRFTFGINSDGSIYIIDKTYR